MTEPRQTLRAGVDAPPVDATPATGLLPLARKPSTSDERWTGGYEYLPKVPPRNLRNRSLLTPADQGANLGSGVTNTPLVQTTPWQLEVEHRITTFQMNTGDPEADAREQLEAYTSMLLERELWTGEIKALENLPNRVLSSVSAITVTGAAQPPQKAVGLLVDAITSPTGGKMPGPIMIHMPKRMALLLPDGWRNPQTLEDHGFVVVAGAGYPGTGPNGTGDNWIYATEVVNVRLTDIEVIPGQLRESILTSENTIPYLARRIGATDFAGPVYTCQVTA